MKRLIRLTEVLNVTGLSRTHVYRLEKEGEFPRRVPLSACSTAWDADEVQGWVRKRIENRDKELAKRKDVGRRLLSARMAA